MNHRNGASTLPLYEYRCTKCNHVFEKIQKFSDPHVSKCPKCGAKVEQVISAPAVQFKGAGWYVNDYAKKGGKGKSDVSSSSESKSSDTKSSETKSSDTKPSSDKK